MLVHIRELVKKADAHKYALGAFNIHNLETALGVARGAQATKSPVIIQVSESTIKYAGLKPITHIVSTIAKNIIPEIPVALHLDHGKTFESVIQCIDAGFTSVHIDASALPLDENIRITKQVIEYAHERDTWVQGEVGMIVGAHGKSGELTEEDIPLADPKEVIEFVQATKVDTISAAVGTAHGVFKNERIHFDLMKEIVDNIQIPFVLHGASGNDSELKRVVELGVKIINIGTDIKASFTQEVIKTALADNTLTDPRDLLTPGIDAVEDVVKGKVELFGSGKFLTQKDHKK